MNENDIWLIAGLGNPEAKYDGTRHNAGFAALDALAGKLERAKSNLAAFDGLDSLEKKLSAARDAAALENARAENRRAALGQLDLSLIHISEPTRH